MKSRDLSFAEVYHSSQFTMLSELFKMNSAAKDALIGSVDCYLSKKSLSIYPSFLPISIAGILMPVPVPSSDIMILETSSVVSSMITAKLPPAF
jgi:hypothetical protein